MGAVVATRRNPVIRAFYRRLPAAGKPILKAMMRTRTTWQQNAEATA